MTIKQMSFYLLFLLGWLLLLLLGESYFSYVLLGGISLSFLLFSSELEWSRANKHKWPLILWLLFLSSVILSSLFSTSLPLSLYSTTKYIFVFLTFWFFLLVKKSFISSQQVIKLLLIVGVVMVVVNTVFQFIPQLLDLLPGTNLLYTTRGHNHLGALLLLLIPLSWWLTSEFVKINKSRWWLLLPVGFTLSLLTSFGRVAVFIGLIQFLFVYQQLKKSNLVKNLQFNFIFKLLIGLFSIVLLGNVFFSTVSLIKPNFVCPVPNLSEKLCKSIGDESRPRYWRWSIEILKDNFWTGSGPGTFSIAAKKHRLAFYNSTSYAHNSFLQAFSELGIFGGGLMIVLMSGLLFLSWKSLGKKSRWDWKSATFLSVASIYLNALFDFDWSFVGILSITMLLLALLVKNGRNKSTKTDFTSFFKTWYLVFILTVIFLAGLYSVTNYLNKTNQARQSFLFFPYFHWHKSLYETSCDLGDEDRKTLFDIYAYHPDVYSVQLSQTNDGEQRQQIKERWFEVDPWSAATRDMISYYLEQQDWLAARSWVDRISTLYSHPIGHGEEFDYELIELKLGNQKLNLVEGYLENGDFQNAFDLLSKMSGEELIWEQKDQVVKLLIRVGNELSGMNIQKTVKAYELAKEHQPWILSVNELWFEQQDGQELSADEIIKYLELTASWKDEEIGWKDDDQRLIQQQAAERFLIANDWSSLSRVLATVDWKQRNDGWKFEFVLDMAQVADDFVREDDYGSALIVTREAQVILPLSYQLLAQSANIMALQGDSNKDDLNRYWEVSRIIHDEISTFLK